MVSPPVIPAEAGIQAPGAVAIAPALDSRASGNDRGMSTEPRSVVLPCWATASPSARQCHAALPGRGRLGHRLP